MRDLTKVNIDFATSHLVFPILIGSILGVLLLAILLTRRRQILASGTLWRQTFGEMDKLRFFGTLLLTVVYFLSMVPVGDHWPNTGMGFLICSIPFVFLCSLLFMHDRSLRGLIPLVIVSIVAPILVWWLFAEIFFLNLP